MCKSCRLLFQLALLSAFGNASYNTNAVMECIPKGQACRSSRGKLTRCCQSEYSCKLVDGLKLEICASNDILSLELEHPFQPTQLDEHVNQTIEERFLATTVTSTATTDAASSSSGTPSSTTEEPTQAPTEETTTEATNPESTAASTEATTSLETEATTSPPTEEPTASVTASEGDTAQTTTASTTAEENGTSSSSAATTAEENGTSSAATTTADENGTSSSAATTPSTSETSSDDNPSSTAVTASSASSTEITPSPTAVTTVIVDESSLDSNEQYTLSYTCIFSPQSATDFSEYCLSLGLKETIEDLMSSYTYTITVESATSGYFTSRVRDRALELEESTVVVFSLEDVSGEIAADVGDYLSLETTQKELLVAYNDVAVTAGIDESTATSLTLTFIGYIADSSTTADDGESNVDTYSSFSTSSIAGIVACGLLILLGIIACAYKKLKNKVVEPSDDDAENVRGTSESNGALNSAVSKVPESCKVDIGGISDKATACVSDINEKSEISGSMNGVAGSLQATSALRMGGAIAAGLNQIGISIPVVGPIVVMCTQLALLFQDYQDTERNCKEIVRWSNAMKDIIKSLEGQCNQYPQLAKEVNLEAMGLCKDCMEELLSLAVEHSKTNMLLKFALSKKTKSLMEEASRSFDTAVATLQLSIATATLSVNMRIDRDINFLLSAVDGMQVQLAKVLEEVMKASDSSFSSTESATKAEKGSKNVVSQEDTYERSFSDNQSKESNDTFEMRDGGKIDATLMRQMSCAIGQLEVRPNELVRLQEVPIGTGGFSKVYKVEYKGHVRAAKVVHLNGISMKMLQKVYLKFSKELYILSKLQSPRVVGLYGCVSSLNEVTLILEYMRKGCLRTVIKDEMEWKALCPSQRHQILNDTIGGMMFLHDNHVSHRDLKSANILITDDYRAKLTDFGLSKTTNAIVTGTKSNFMGGTVAWLAPEGFDQIIGDGYEADLYSFGVVIWEVMAGILGEQDSKPWAGKSDAQIMKAVTSGLRPTLPSFCISEDNVMYSATYEKMMKQCFSEIPQDRPTFRCMYETIGEKASCNV